MFSSSSVCYIRQLFLFKHITEQNTDDSIKHTRLRGPTVIPMQISWQINARLRIPTGTALGGQPQSGRLRYATKATAAWIGWLLLKARASISGVNKPQSVEPGLL